MCVGVLTTTSADNVVDSVTGEHEKGKSNDDVTAVNFRNMKLEVLPKNLNSYFKNFRTLLLISPVDLPNFKRSDFSDFAGLTALFVGLMESITTLPRDTFYDMTSLKALYLESNRNMENLHGDLLVNQRQLEFFSARGPNKINQISPGFFRYQMDTITLVVFTGTNLLRVGHSVFDPMPALQDARFEQCGCLNSQFQSDADLTAAIRAKCQDVIIRENRIVEKSIRKTWNSDSDSAE